MSYVRLSSHSDVYVFHDVAGYLHCCGCLLGGGYTTQSRVAMVAHLKEHKASSHQVPLSAIARLRWEKRTFGDVVAFEEDRNDRHDR